ncbi:MAG: hypothetical protein ACK53L_11225, partial [Pirellulaceae bacterium]
LIRTPRGERSLSKTADKDDDSSRDRRDFSFLTELSLIRNLATTQDRRWRTVHVSFVEIHLPAGKFHF